jgi:hypothetical protein
MKWAGAMTKPILETTVHFVFVQLCGKLEIVTFHIFFQKSMGIAGLTSKFTY